MASYCKVTGSDKYRIRFYLDGWRKEMMIPTGNERTARRIADMVDRLLEAKQTGQADKELNLWLSGIADDLRARLERAGLLEVAADRRTLEDLRAHVENLPGKLNTKKNRRQWFGYLLEFREASFPLTSFTREMAAEYCVYIRRRNKSGESSERGIVAVKSFFREAVRLHWLSENPFEFCKTHRGASDKPVPRITEADLQRVLDCCPNKKWRAILALLRYCGLRGGSELRGLDWSIDSIRWGTVDAVGTITVRSTKQEHIDKRRERIIPFPPIVEKLLLDWLQASKAEEKENYPNVPMFPDIADKMTAQESIGIKVEYNLNTVVKRLFNNAGVPITCAYDLRKNCCSDWLTPDNNGNTLDVMVYEQVAGHDIAVGKKYYQKLFPDRLAKGFEQLAQRWAVNKDSSPKSSPVAP